MTTVSSKNKLITATIQAIYKNGLHSVTTSKIAKIAKLSEAMIYKNFGNKDDLIVETFISIKSDLNIFIESSLPETTNFDDISYKIWLAHVDYFLSNPKCLRVLNQIEHSNYMTEELRAKCLKFSKSVMSFFNLGLTNKIIKPMHIEIAIALFFSPILSICDSIIENRIDKTEDNLKLIYNSTMIALKI